MYTQAHVDNVAILVIWKYSGAIGIMSEAGTKNRMMGLWEQLWPMWWPEVGMNSVSKMLVEYIQQQKLYKSLHSCDGIIAGYPAFAPADQTESSSKCGQIENEDNMVQYW